MSPSFLKWATTKNVANHTLARLDSFIAAVDGQRLTYKRLTA